MASKKVSYIELLKEAIHEFDTSKTVDVKGPMVDPILKYDGGGELPTHKDAASILERFYFNKDEGKVNVVEHEDNEISEVPPTEDSGVSGEKKEIEKEVTEQEENEQEENEKDEEKEEVTEQDEAEEEDSEKEEVEEIENAVIENMIKEMEEEGDEGAGTKAAGTGDAEKEVPDRNDMTNEDECLECGLTEQDEENENEKDEEDLDVDEELEEAMDPVDTPKGGEDEEELEEAFNFFKEQIEEEEEDEKEEVTEAKKVAKKKG